MYISFFQCPINRLRLEIKQFKISEETKEQIEQLEQKVKHLEKEKQQLFMQLKKLLNEDEIRKRQQQKENK